MPDFQRLTKLIVKHALACFSEASRQRAFECFEFLRAHLEGGRPLAAIAREAGLSYRTLQYWLERYRKSGLGALARKQRPDCGRRRKLSPALQAIILWKTVYLGHAGAELRVQGETLPDTLLAHIGPLGWEHIQLHWRLGLAVRTAQRWVSAAAKSALRVPRCRLAYVLEQILR
jgi:transposase-like protein